MRASSLRAGIEATQGGHQVAQKLTRTTRPFSSASETGLPLTSVATIAGAGLPSQVEAGHPILEMVPDRRGGDVGAGQAAELAGDVVAALADQALEQRLADGQREIGIEGGVGPAGGLLEEILPVVEGLVVLALVGARQDLDQRGQGADVAAGGG